MTVPILDLRRSFKEIKPEVFEALERIFENQSFILGSEVSNFERHCEKYLELPEGSAAGCASGTDALLLALMKATRLSRLRLHFLQRRELLPGSELNLFSLTLIRRLTTLILSRP